MSTQTVYRLTSFDGFEGLQPFREPIPEPSPGEVLVKIRSVALNYRDVVIATSQYPLPIKDNVVPCCDMAGEVVAIGPPSQSSFQSPGFAVGDAVIAPPAPLFLYGSSDRRADSINYAWGGGNQDGLLREYIALPAHILIKLPPCVTPRDFVRWAATPCTVATVWNAFYGHAPLKPGDTVLILGTGGVSLSALVLAKAAGATTIVTSSSDKKLESVKSRLGPDYTINYKTNPDWATEVQNIMNGNGVDHIIEEVQYPL
ncbi:chaperonin 10-like protein [Xylariaceae sp. FL1651]|nr:chaperonin 10-like protein [Xylariaceae sp. FL1651]